MTEHLPEVHNNDASPASQAVFPDLLGIVLRRKLYLVLGTILGCVLGFLFYSTAQRKYESTAQILVLKKENESPLQSVSEHGAPAAPTGSQQDFLETHKAVLKSPLVVGRAVEKAHLADMEMFRNDPRPVETIIKGLKIEREIDKKAAARYSSQVLVVSFQGTVPEECSAVVAAVLDSYQDFLNESSRGPLRETLKLFTEARKLIQRDLDDKEKAYAEFRKNTPVLWKNGDGSTLYMLRLSNIDAQRAALIREQAELEATLTAVDTALKGGRGPLEAMQIIAGMPASREVSQGAGPVATGRMPAPGQAAAAGPVVPARSSLEDDLVRLQMEEGKLLETLGPKHPEVQSVREQMQTIQALLAPARIGSGKGSERELRAVQRTVETKIGQMKQQLREIKRSQDALNDLFKTELEEAKKAFPYETQDDAFKRQIGRSEFLYENLMKRMEDLNLLSNVGGYDAQVIAPAEVGVKVSPKGSVVFPVALFLGLLCGFGLGYLAEVRDKTFRSPEEIRTRLGVPLIGHIPVLTQNKELLQKIEAEESPLQPVLCTYYRPRSRDAEAYRGVRTALYFSTRGRSHRVIQVTSPDMGDGKSTLAANLAISMAQSGKRVLLVDADFRRPQQNDLFGLPNEVGFATLLSGAAELPDALQQTVVPNLTVMTTGKLPHNPAELLTSARLQDILGILGDRYDLVLIDTPPLLAVTDPSVVAARVDGVVMTLRLGKQSRPRGERAREILGTLGARVLGVVVNAVQGSGMGGYGGYGGYGSYGEYGNSRYYQDEEQATSNGKAATGVH